MTNDFDAWKHETKNFYLYFGARSWEIGSSLDGSDPIVKDEGNAIILIN